MDHAALQSLFGDRDFGFSMHVTPADPKEFFQPSPQAERILAERVRWLRSDGERHLQAAPDVDRFIDGARDFFAGIGNQESRSDAQTMIDLLAEVGRTWEPDVLIVAPNAEGDFILLAGCVCFPSGWSLEEKIGLPVHEIHGVVPGLNAAIGTRISNFLARLKPRSAWARSNWGISSTAELNQHPARGVNVLRADTSPGSIWLRLEHQLLARLPGSDAVLFAIRLQNIPLVEIGESRALRAGLRRALATMPDAVAAYKNLAAVRPALLAWLSDD
ncbi:DUF3445 domain-containing protein [bacterium]|nr:DUF3445 domain-containing protein [bacterium]